MTTNYTKQFTVLDRLPGHHQTTQYHHMTLIIRSHFLKQPFVLPAKIYSMVIRIGFIHGIIIRKFGTAIASSIIEQFLALRML